MAQQPYNSSNYDWFPKEDNTSRLSKIYNFIYDIEQIEQFSRLIGQGTHQLYLSSLPKDTTDEQKIFENIKITHFFTKTFLNDEEDKYVNNIKAYHVPYGLYKYKGKDIPGNQLVIYGTTNSRSPKKAARVFINYILTALFSGNDNAFQDMTSELSESIMENKNMVKIVTIKINSKEDYPEVENFLKEKGIASVVIETRGGYHVLLRAGKGINMVHKQFNRKHIMGDIFCPIPGTYQGGFKVRFVGKTDFNQQNENNETQPLSTLDKFTQELYSR